MTKSLTELAQAMAAAKPVVRQPVAVQAPVRPSHHDHPPRRPMYAVVCYECGKDTSLPFKPSGNRPVYCRECFALRKGRAAAVKVQSPAVPIASVPSVQPMGSPSAPAVKGKRKAVSGKSAKAKSSAAKKSVKKKKSPAKKKSSTKKKTAPKKRVTKKKTASRRK